MKPDQTFETDTSSLQDFIIAINKEKADHLRYEIEGDFVKVYITPYKTSISEKDFEFMQGDFNVDLVIAIDVETGEKLDAALSEYGSIMHDATAINITTNQAGHFAELEWSDPSYSSVCEMIAKLADALGYEEYNASTATAILTGIVAATERFSNARTTSETMALSSKLMQAGADQQLISSNVMNETEQAPAAEPVAEPAPAPAIDTAPIPESTPAPAPEAPAPETLAGPLIPEPTLGPIDTAPIPAPAEPVAPIPEPAPAPVAPIPEPAPAPEPAPTPEPAPAPAADPALQESNSMFNIPAPAPEPAPTAEPAAPVAPEPVQEFPQIISQGSVMKQNVAEEAAPAPDYGAMIDQALMEEAAKPQAPINPAITAAPSISEMNQDTASIPAMQFSPDATPAALMNPAPAAPTMPADVAAQVSPAPVAEPAPAPAPIISTPTEPTPATEAAPAISQIELPPAPAPNIDFSAPEMPPMMVTPPEPPMSTSITEPTPAPAPAPAPAPEPAPAPAPETPAAPAAPMADPSAFQIPGM